MSLKIKIHKKRTKSDIENNSQKPTTCENNPYSNSERRSRRTKNTNPKCLGDEWTV